MTVRQDKPAPAVPASVSPSAAAAGGIGAMAVCCTLTLLVAAGALGSLSGTLIGGIAVGAGIAIAATAWAALVWLRRRRTRRSACCAPDTGYPGADGSADTGAAPTGTAR
jgi:hypothetical protein